MTTVRLALPPRPTLAPLLVVGVLSLGYLIFQPFSADLAAQVYRTDLFDHVGFALWNGQWFGGHHTPGYSVLFPPLASLVGPRVVGVLCAIASAVLFERMVTARWGSRARLGAIWFGAASATSLFTGRLTFGLGMTLALAALLALQRGRARTAVAFAALTPLGSPVAALMLAMAALAHGLASRRRLSLVVGAAAFAVAGAIAVAFPEGGRQPFPIANWWPTVAFAIPVLLLVPREEKAIRWGAVLYALACTAALLIDTPMGSNAQRLGTVFGGPLLACVLWRRRTLALAVLAVPLLYWQWVQPVRDVRGAANDPSVDAAFYLPVNTYLAGRQPTGRVEIPSLRNHWETVHVAPHFALARGWERQLDIKYNGLFYEKRLDPIAYRTWLLDNGVQFVAIPEAPLDSAAIQEASLVKSGLPYLKPVYGNADWRVYEFKYAVPLVSGDARLVRLEPTSFTLRASSSGIVDVRVRYTPYWELQSGVGCVEEGPGGFTRLRLDRPGPVRVQADFSPARLVDHGPRCRAAPAA
jgi:hypothetical protein